MHGGMKPLPLYLKEILERHTDAEHGLQMGRIIELLSIRGITVTRKGIYSMMDVLEYDLGMDISRPKGADKTYKLLSRTFDVEELRMMIDALGASEFLSRADMQRITRKLYSLCSKWQEKGLRELADGMQDKADSPVSGLDNLAYIQYALENQRGLAFDYCEDDLGMWLPAGPRWRGYSVKPLTLAYTGNDYYLQDEAGSRYHVNRMTRLRIV